MFANLCPTLKSHSCILTHQPIPGGTIPLHLSQYVENTRDAVCRSHHRRCNALPVPPLPPQLLAHLLNTTQPQAHENTLKKPSLLNLHDDHCCFYLTCNKILKHSNAESREESYIHMTESENSAHIKC